MRLASLHFKPTKQAIWKRSSRNNLLLLESEVPLPKLTRLFVYDVITQQHKKLPELMKQGVHNLTTLMYDESIQKYKVFVIDCVSIFGLIRMCFNFTLDQYRKRWRSLTWRLSKPPIPQRLIRRTSPVIIKGVLYRISQEYDGDFGFQSNDFKLLYSR